MEGSRYFEEEEGLELFTHSCTPSIALEPTQYHSCIHVQQLRQSFYTLTLLHYPIHTYLITSIIWFTYVSTCSAVILSPERAQSSTAHMSRNRLSFYLLPSRGRSRCIWSSGIKYNYLSETTINNFVHSMSMELCIVIGLWSSTGFSWIIILVSRGITMVIKAVVIILFSSTLVEEASQLMWKYDLKTTICSRSIEKKDNRFHDAPLMTVIMTSYCYVSLPSIWQIEIYLDRDKDLKGDYYISYQVL